MNEHNVTQRSTIEYLSIENPFLLNSSFPKQNWNRRKNSTKRTKDSLIFNARITINYMAAPERSQSAHQCGLFAGAAIQIPAACPRDANHPHGTEAVLLFVPVAATIRTILRFWPRAKRPGDAERDRENRSGAIKFAF